jgi:predicted hydrocarbon binding protein
LRERNVGNGRGNGSTGQGGFYFPNKMGRIALLAMEEVMGRNGVNALLNLANLRHFLGNYPPNNFERNVSFNDLSKLLAALDEMYGSRSGRALGLRAGRACFRFGARDLGPLLGAADVALRIMPLTVKLKIGFEVFAEVFNKFSDHQVRLGEDEGAYFWTVEQCGSCWGRTTTAPCCHLMVGFLQEALYWISGGQTFDVEEIACIAVGDSACMVRIGKQAVD